LFLALKKNIANLSKNLKESVVTIAVIEEPKKTEDLPQIKVDKSPENIINVSIILFQNIC